MVVGNGGSMLSLSNRILICIARALLSSVDLLLLANTLDLLSDDQIEQIIKILHELVHNRGLPFLSNDVGTIPIQLRKRKTVFFITNKEKIERMATVSLRCDTSFLSAEVPKPEPKPKAYRQTPIGLCESAHAMLQAFCGNR